MRWNLVHDHGSDLNHILEWAIVLLELTTSNDVRDRTTWTPLHHELDNRKLQEDMERWLWVFHLSLSSVSRHDFRRYINSDGLSCWERYGEPVSKSHADFTLASQYGALAGRARLPVRTHPRPLCDRTAGGEAAEDYMNAEGGWCW